MSRKLKLLDIAKALSVSTSTVHRVSFGASMGCIFAMCRMGSFRGQLSHSKTTSRAHLVLAPEAMSDYAGQPQPGFVATSV